MDNQSLNDQFPTNQSANNQPDASSSTRHHSGKRWVWSLIAVIVVAVGIYQLGYVAGEKGFVLQPKDFKIVNQNDQTATVDYNLLWEALKVVQQKFIDKDNVDQQKILYGAIDGAVQAAGDEYTEFFDPEELQSFRTELRGRFEGIGAEVGKRNDNIVIIAPLDDTPAQRAGLLAKDIIVQINGQSTAGIAVDEAVSKIRGPKGTEVTLSIFREGRPQPFEVKITRDTISVRSVKVEYKDVQGKKIALVTLSRFGDDSKELFDQAILQVLSSGSAGLVLDLRNNPGGYLETAVDVASNWVDKGKLVVTEAHSEKDSVPYTSYGYNRLASMKTVVLVNGGSASAAEIVAGALQDHNIAQLVGEKTFGKGSVQELIELPNNTALKVTIAKWITPSGRNLNKDGLVPNIEIKLSEDDINSDRDPQLDRALEEVVK